MRTSRLLPRPLIKPPARSLVSFYLVGHLDADGDGIPYAADECPLSDLDGTVVIDGCDSGVTNHVLDSGCSILDLIDNCVSSARNHGKFVSCVSHLTNALKKAGIISGAEKDLVQSCAAEADIP